MRRVVLVLFSAFLLVVLFGVGFTYVQGGSEAVERRVAAVPAYARTYLRSLRPAPVLPTPPPVPAERRAALLQTHLPTVMPTAFPPATMPPTFTPLPSLPAPATQAPLPSETPTAEPSPSPTPTASATPFPLTPVAPGVSLDGVTYHAQMWNNCGPATLTMNLSYYGIGEHQRVGAAFLKPNADDKNVSPDQLLAYAYQHGLDGVVRSGGDLNLLRRFIANGFPVIVETWIEPDDHGGMGHYRLLTAYDEGTFTAQDSYYGPNRRLYGQELDLGWRVFNHKFIVLFPPEEREVVEALLGPLVDDETMYTSTLRTAQEEAAAAPDDVFAWFNLGTAYTRLNQPEAAADAFDEARRIGLPLRMLWYQFEPFEAYLAVGRYDDVIELGYVTAYTASGHEEAYFYEALGYLGKGNLEMTVSRLRKALDYNPNYEPAAAALDEIGASP
ncbi:MAG: C39 family peptidase [Anaerolineae bacterium]|nr:C39 family peptidase [Anaerolineae bacterium]